MQLVVPKLALAAVSAAFACMAHAADWRNLTAECHLGGRKASAGYLQGKVVLVCRWDGNAAAAKSLLPRVEQVWRNFKTKPFVVVGSYEGADDAQARAAGEEHSLSFAIYREAGLAFGAPVTDTLPFMYVVDASGRVVYRGRDDRVATQACVMAIADSESPRNLAQWRRFLEFELENLPGRAYLRVLDFRKAFPEEAREYDGRARELSKIPDVKKLAELVKASRELKDALERTEAERRKRMRDIDSVIRKYSSLTSHADRRVSQEAKNAIADLKWTLASL